MCNKDDRSIPLHGSERNPAPKALTTLTESRFLTRDRSFNKFIECPNRLFRDALTIFASYPNVRTRACDNVSSFERRSLGQQTPSFVQVFVRWPRNPWTNTMLRLTSKSGKLIY